ncbi:flavodoxin family protein [Herbiconiux sp. P15]|uniref:flavodoxin family protein n=1 Tax=Herbiconiux liukaitaii TaxID=3342799 RepID=UPI0035BB3B58
MRAVVVYESMFGTTRQIAEAIADGLADCFEVTLVEVDRVTPADFSSADLMVVGGPTHVHGMSRGTTRAEAVAWAHDPAKHVTLEPGAPGRGIRDWVSDPGTVVAPLFAAFSTRADIPVIFSGDAATQIDRSLRRLASRRVVHAESFTAGKGDHLLGEEIVRARGWGSRVGSAAAALTAAARAGTS